MATPQAMASATVMARLATAVVAPDEEFEGECTTEAVLARLSPHDRNVLANIAKRIVVLERSRGAAEAEAALEEILLLLSDGRQVA